MAKKKSSIEAVIVEFFTTADPAAKQTLRQLVLLYGWQPTLTAVQHLMRERDAAAQLAWSDREPAAEA